VDKPWFEEHWIFFRKFRGRWVLRALPTQRRYPKAGKGPIFWRGHFADPESPPYIFSPAFFDNPEWVPTTSALPPHWEALIPSDLRWWTKQYSRQKRLALIAEAHNYLISEGYLRGRPVELAAKPRAIRWVLHLVAWRGPVHVRGAWRRTYYLRIFEGDKYRVYASDDDPRQANFGASIAFVAPEEDAPPPEKKDFKSWLKFEGEIPPGHPENPNKELVAKCTLIDSGSGEIEPLQGLSGFLLALDGKELKGYYRLIAEMEGAPFYKLEKVGGGEK